MLAGRKLLLADDSITIQKVVALTFADEGVEVVTVSNGHEAIEQLQRFAPDIVLADLFMPEVNGYEVCRFVKQNAKLKHIPVMLLVGSFEPFDEAEARRVGADDILTKPFQSIRRLIDKVGGLVGSKSANEATTAELPHAQEEAAEPEKLSTAELEITTADTQPLPVAQRHADFPAYEPADLVPKSDYRSYEPVVETQPSGDLKPESFQEGQTMDSSRNKLSNDNTSDSGEVLLDLGDISRPSVAASDDFVLDIDFDESESAVEAAAASGPRSFVESRSERAMEIAQAENPQSTAWMDTSELAKRQQGLLSKGNEAARGRDKKLADTQEWKRESGPSASGDLKRVTNEEGGTQTAAPSGQVRLDQLSPEVIDAIARRAVEQLSTRVVEEIAWEVVPQLAELMIKRKLEENQSQRK